MFYWVGSPISRTVGLVGCFCLRCLGRSISVEMGLVINYMSSSIGWALGALGKWILYLTQYIIPVRHYIPLRMLNQVKYTF